MILGLSSDQIRFLIIMLVIPTVVLIINFIVRKSTYYTFSADLLLLFLIFDLSSMVCPSEISLIIRNSKFRDLLIPILVLLLLLTLVLWLLIVLRFEPNLIKLIFEAVQKASKKANSFQQLRINWPGLTLFLAWFFSGLITVFHLGLLFMP